MRIVLALFFLLSIIDARAVTGRARKYTFYDMPTPVAGPCDVCEGPDGALWVQDQFVNKIARIDPGTGLVEEYEIPFSIPPSTNISLLPNIGGRIVLACAIRPGRDGNVYASNGLRNQLVRINTTTRHIDVFTPPNYNPLGDLQPFNDLYSSEDGIYFSQTTSDQLSFFDFATEQITSYTIPTLSSSPLGVFVASDGNVYFAELLASKLGRFNPPSKTFEEFDLPVALAGPAVVRVETKNQFIYFTSIIGNGIGRFDMKTGGITAYTDPTLLAFPAEDTVDSQGNIWFSTFGDDTLNKLNPKNKLFSSIKQPDSILGTPLQLPYDFDVAINYGPGNALFFTQAISNRVGRYDLG